MTGDGKGDAGSLEPYQILGDSAKAHNLFWGWEHDSGHVASTRFVDEFLIKNPNAAENPQIKEWYASMNNLDSVDAIYQPALEKLDEIYGNKVERNYVGQGRTIDTLLDSISVATDTKSELKDSLKTQLSAISDTTITDKDFEENVSQFGDYGDSDSLKVKFSVDGEGNLTSKLNTTPKLTDKAKIEVDKKYSPIPQGETFESTTKTLEDGGYLTPDMKMKKVLTHFLYG